MKIFLLVVIFLALNKQLFAQYRLDASVGLQTNNVYDERLSSNIYTGQSKNWQLGLTTKSDRLFQINFSSKELYPNSKGLLSNQDVFHFKEAGLHFMNNRIFLDSMKLPVKLHWGYIVGLNGRYCAQVLSSTILPYDQTLISFQIALTLGIHLKATYPINDRQLFDLDIITSIINTGANNAYSPHDNWYLYKTLLFPKYIDFYVPLTYSYRLNKKIVGKLSFIYQYYKFSDIQSNIIFKTSILGSVEYIFN